VKAARDIEDESAGSVVEIGSRRALAVPPGTLEARDA
jgi:hypothetical protein